MVDTTDGGWEFVPADFARQLEQENDQLQRHIASLVENIRNLQGMVQSATRTIEAWKAEEEHWHEMNEKLRAALHQIATTELARGQEELTLRRIAKSALAGIASRSEREGKGQ